MRTLRANELRMNNVVEINGNPYVIDHALEIHDIQVDNVEAFGIELNESWLVRMGFEKGEGAEFNSYTLNNVCIDHYYKNESFLFTFLGQTDNMVWVNIEHVHQLQNLYFALTGTELEIKEA